MFEEDAKLRQEIRSLQKQRKKNPLLFARLGECYLRLGDWNKAEPILKKGVHKHPEYATGYLVLGEGYFLNGKYQDAEEVVMEGIQQNPEHLGLLMLLLKVKSRLADRDEVLKLEAKLKELDPLQSFTIGAPTETQRSLRQEPITPEAPPAPKLTEPPTATLPVQDTELPPPAPEPLQSKRHSWMDITELPSEDESIESPSSPPKKEHSAEIEDTTPTPVEEESSPPPRRIATRTLGELYARQQQYDEAVKIYKELTAQDPANTKYQARLEELVKLRDSAPENLDS